jgi:hypothetical protein
MRKLTRKDWAGSHPGTNVLWLQYLTELLLSSDKPVPGASAVRACVRVVCVVCVCCVCV